MLCLSLQQKFPCFLENSQKFVKKLKDLEERRDFNSQIWSPDGEFFSRWLLRCLPTNMTFCLWGLMRVEVEHSFPLFGWQSRIHSRMLSNSVLAVLYSHFMLVSRTPSRRSRHEKCPWMSSKISEQCRSWGRILFSWVYSPQQLLLWVFAQRTQPNTCWC